MLLSKSPALFQNRSVGGLIGEMTYRIGQRVTATVIVDTASRILAFECDALEGCLDRNDDIRAALEQSPVTCATSSPPLPDSRRG